MRFSLKPNSVMAVFEVRMCLLCSTVASKRRDACPLQNVKQLGERRRMPLVLITASGQ